MTQSSETTLHLQLDYEEATQLLWLMNRAVNSLQPEKWPALTQQLLDHLEKYIERK
jgi:hypothetical protein